MSAPQPSSELTLVVDATYARSTGYGHVWTAAVRRVVDGSLADHEIDLSLFDDLEGAKYAGRFRSLDRETAVTIHFRRIATRPAAFVGFTAADGTLWQVAGVEP